MTRSEHLQWAKTRAKEYLPGEPHEAFMSFVSDIRKHPEVDPTGIVGQLGMSLLAAGAMKTAQQVREFIDGAN